MLLRSAIAVFLNLVVSSSCAAQAAPRVDPVDLLNLLFESGQSTRTTVFNPSQLLQLQEVADDLKLDPTLRVSVNGYADPTEGSDAECQVISELRAQLVYDWLVAQGVARQLKGYKGFGKSGPVDFSNTEAQRHRNRRVEFAVEYVR